MRRRTVRCCDWFNRQRRSAALVPHQRSSLIWWRSPRPLQRFAPVSSAELMRLSTATKPLHSQTRSATTCPTRSVSTVGRSESAIANTCVDQRPTAADRQAREPTPSDHERDDPHRMRRLIGKTDEFLPSSATCGRSSAKSQRRGSVLQEWEALRRHGRHGVAKSCRSSIAAMSWRSWTTSGTHLCLNAMFGLSRQLELVSRSPPARCSSARSGPRCAELRRSGPRPLVLVFRSSELVADGIPRGFLARTSGWRKNRSKQRYWQRAL